MINKLLNFLQEIDSNNIKIKNDKEQQEKSEVKKDNSYLKYIIFMILIGILCGLIYYNYETLTFA